MKRHRGKFDPNNDQPYELSRSRIENFFKCPACFYMQQVEGIVFPSIPGFNINEATDILLKRDFDFYREKQESHPFLISKGYSHLIPFQHENFELWTQSLHFGAKDRMHYDHLDTNLRIGGGLDDVWFNQKTSKIHIVDYKSTSQKKDYGPINLDDYWKSAYKRQMDLYVWIMKQKGLDVDDVGFFLYCDGDRFTTNNFLRNQRWLDDPHQDPWDNHSGDKMHWTHKWIYHQERGELDELNNIMTAPGVWGISYGAWPQTKRKWETPATCILVEPTQKTFDFYWQCYAERPIYDVQNSFDMHILDHHQNLFLDTTLNFFLFYYCLKHILYHGLDDLLQK